jgi:hypothetical protein
LVRVVRVLKVEVLNERVVAAVVEHMLPNRT